MCQLLYTWAVSSLQMVSAYLISRDVLPLCHLWWHPCYVRRAIPDPQDLDIQDTCSLHLSVHHRETWTVRAEVARILESFHMKCQRQILGIRWQDHVRNVEVANQTGLPPVMDHIVNVATPFLVTSAGCRALSQSIKLYAVRLTWPLVVSQTDHGNVVLVVLWNVSWTKSVTTANAY